MDIKKKFNLQEKNTFGISIETEIYAEFATIQELTEILKQYKDVTKNYLVLGEGSNILFTENFDGIILKPISKNITIISEDEDNVYISADAGVIWDDFVAFTVKNNLYGIENLSYIPGTVGACPVQNIGAYGVEVKDVIESVEVFFLNNFQIKSFKNEECEFGYRDSIFKRNFKGKIIIYKVNFKLKKKKEFILNYGNLADNFINKDEITLAKLRQKIIEIRKEKLPEPKENGNAGSFFKNPVIRKQTFQKIQELFPKIPAFEIDDNLVKIPAAWLIETVGWKGKTEGNVAVHSKQALVIINQGNASGKEIIEFAKKIQNLVYEKFEISLEIEVNIF